MSLSSVPPPLHGRTVVVTHPGKLLVAEAAVTKLDLVNYYLAVADGALRGAGGRPCILVRYPDGIGQAFFFQKRAPARRPDWLEVAQIRFPSGRSAEEVVPRHPADLAWMANLACLELHPHPVRAEDLEHPDELRVDLDPVPGVEWPQIVQVAQVVHGVLTELGLQGWPKTSGSRGIHVLVRIEPRWTFDEVRRAALALAREVERRAPALATSKWWKEERHGVFVDYNQNAKDRTVAAAYSVRPKPDARVSAPLGWDELETCAPGDFTLWTMPKRFARIGDPHAAIDGENQGTIVNLADHRAATSRRAQLDLLADLGPDKLAREAAKVSSRTIDAPAPAQAELPYLVMPARHDVRGEDVIERRLHATLAAAADNGPRDFAGLLLTAGVGARTVEALAMVAEVLHGAPCRFADPARFSLAHGGKDRHPYAVPLKVYDETIPMLTDDGRFDRKGLDVLAQSFVDMNMLPEKPDMSKLYTEKLLPAAK